jgi:hypothetical protein
MIPPLPQVTASGLSPKGLSPAAVGLWSINVVGLAHALVSFLTALVLLVGYTDAPGGGCGVEPTPLRCRLTLSRLLTGQMLLSCGFYAYHLFHQLSQVRLQA